MTIPQSAREILASRDNQQCQRCGVRAAHWHHRRSRSIHDEHTNCACNGVLLCSECHRWVHAHPEESRRLGFIVSRYVEEPGTVPIVTFMGIRWFSCEK